MSRFTMKFLASLVDRIRRYNQPLDKWHMVTFSSNQIDISASPPGRQAWEQSLKWDKIIRVMFQGAGLEGSDEVFIWTDERPESYVVPTDSNGGSQLVDEFISRGYFSSEKFTKAVLSPYGCYCWPEDEKET